MKTLITYYSYEGNCALAAGLIKSALGADELRLRTEEDKPRGFAAKYFWGGKMVLSRARPRLLPYTVDIDQYGLIIIGTPVWAGSYAPALASFFAKTKITGKKIALFCCHAGGKGKVFRKLKDALPGNTFAGEIDFYKPLARNAEDEVKERLGPWLAGLAEGP